MSKKVLLLFLIFTLLSIPTVFATDNPQPIKVYVDGTQLTFAEQPVIENDVTLVQFRPIFEKLGLKIEWNADTQMITGRSASLIIKLTIGSTSAVVNDEVKTLVIAPKIVNDNTMVPLRFVSQASGKEVIWDGDNRNIWIHDLASVTPTTSPTPSSTPSPTPSVTPTSIVNSDQSLGLDDSYIFRKVNLGMTMDEVRLAESPKKLLLNKESLSYDIEISKSTWYVEYDFTNGKLNSISGFLRDKHDDPNVFVTNLITIRDLFATKLKIKPNSFASWNSDFDNTLYKDDKSKWGKAVTEGRLMLLSTWEGLDYSFALKLDLSNGEPFLHFLIFSNDKGKPSPSPSPTPSPTTTPVPTPDKSAYINARNTELKNELARLKQTLTNTQNEKNVKIYQDGAFVWVADPHAVQSALDDYNSALDYYNTWKATWGVQ